LNTYLTELYADPHCEEVSEALFLRKTNIQSALDTFKEFAKKGSAISLCALGDIYAYGRFGIEADHEKAEQYLQKAKDIGSIEGAYRLARFYEYRGNSNKAIEGLIALSEKGFSPATFLLGCKYRKGDIVDEDLEQAFFYFKKAGEQGHLIARQWVGYLLRKRKGLLNKIRGTMIIGSTILPIRRAHKVDSLSDCIRIV
tara:strand:- start:465 stop:1061 length:597 start_codon:yes stop_codon:yes gene_type:complete